MDGAMPWNRATCENLSLQIELPSSCLEALPLNLSNLTALDDSPYHLAAHLYRLLSPPPHLHAFACKM